MSNFQSIRYQQLYQNSLQLQAEKLAGSDLSIDTIEQWLASNPELNRQSLNTWLLQHTGHPLPAKFVVEPIRVLLKEYLRELSSSAGGSTIRNYRSDIKQFLATLPTTDPEKVFSIPNLRSFTHQQLAKGLKESSVTRKISSISQFGQWLVNTGAISTNLDWLANFKLKPDSPDKMAQLDIPLHTPLQTETSTVETKINQVSPTPATLLKKTVLSPTRTETVMEMEIDKPRGLIFKAATVLLTLMLLFGTQPMWGRALQNWLNDEPPAADSNTRPRVLGLADDLRTSQLVFNIPTNFRNTLGVTDLVVDDSLSVGGDGLVTGDLSIDGNLFASNIVNSVVGGDGISVSTGANPIISLTDNPVYSIEAGEGITVTDGDTVTITLDDEANAQNINAFTTVTANGSSITAGSNSSELLFESSGNVTLSTSGNTVTIGATDNSPFVLSGSSVILDDVTNSVSLGGTSASAKLDVFDTSEQLRLGYDASNFSSFTTLSNGNLRVTNSGQYINIGDGSATPASIDEPESVFIEGDLEVAGDIIGNIVVTLNPGFTQGSVGFQGAGGLDEDNANFFWDDTNNRLGLGTNNPQATLNVVSTSEQFRLNYDGSNYTSATVTSGGNLQLNTTGGQLQLADTDVLKIGGLTSGTYNSIANGTDSPNFPAFITDDDDLYIGGNLEVASRIYGDVQGDFFITGATTGGVTFIGASGSITQNATQFYWNNATNQLAIGHNSPSATLDVSGTAEITGNTTLGGTLGVAGATTLSSNLGVVGTSSLADVTISSTLDVTGATNLASTLDVTGAATFDGTVTVSNGVSTFNYSTADTNTAVIINNTGNGYSFRVNDNGAGDTSPFVIDEAGNVLIGSTTASNLLTVGSSQGFQVDDSGDLVRLNGVTYSWPSSQGGIGSVITNSDGAGTLTWGTLGAGAITDDSLDFAQFEDSMTLDDDTEIDLFDGTTDRTFRFFNSDSTAEYLFLDGANDRVGIGTASPNTWFEVMNTSTQLRLSYDASNYADFTVDSSGMLTIAGSNGAVTIDDNLVLSDTHTLQVGGLTSIAYNAFANAGDAPDSGAIDSDRDVYIGRNLEVDGVIYGTFEGDLSGSVVIPSLTDGSVIFASSGGALDENNSLFYWDDTVGTQGLGLGTNTPVGLLDIVGANNQVQFTIQGYDDPADLDDQSADLIQIKDLAGTVVSRFDADGRFSSDLGTAATNLFLGVDSGNSTNTGGNNTAIGLNTLQDLTTGISNVVLGGLSGVEIQGGNQNTGLGASSLRDLVSGANNTAVGAISLFNALGSDNTAIGVQAGAGLVNGSNNTFVGNLAGGDVTAKDFSNSTYLGSRAGYFSTGSNNVFIGYAAGEDELGSNLLYIENSDSASPLIWGNFSSNFVNINGSLGINDSSPGYGLDVNGTGRFVNLLTLDSGFDSNSASTVAGLTVDGGGNLTVANGTTFLSYAGASVAATINNTGSSDSLVVNDSATDTTPFVIDESGNVGIGVSNPASKLDVNGNILLSPASLPTIATATGNLQLSPAGGNVQIWDNTNSFTLNVFNGATIGASIASNGDSYFNGGDLGIGTTSPSYLLDVAGDINFTGALRANGSAGTTGQLLVSQGAGNPLWQDASTALSGDFFIDGGNSFGAAAVLGTNDNFDLNFETNGTTAMTIDTSGNVGIGTTAPSYKLRVAGNIVANNNNRIGFDDGGGNLHSYLQGGTHTTLSTGGGGRDIILQATDGSGILRDKFVLPGLDSNVGAYVNYGNFGIGTIAPTSILDVQQAGTVAAETTLLEITNSANSAVMNNTATALDFNQFYYDATTPAAVKAAQFVYNTTGNWTSSNTTHEGYLSIKVVDGANMRERIRLDSDAARIQTLIAGNYNNAQLDNARLTVDNSGWSNPAVAIKTSGGAGRDLIRFYNDSNQVISLIDYNGNFGAGINMAPAAGKIESEVSNNENEIALYIDQLDSTNNPQGIFINNLGSGHSIEDDSGARLTAGGVWTNSSDVTKKENFVALDQAEVLTKINNLSIQQWNYIEENDTITHIGPTAQDFYAQFGLGGSDTSISTIDPAGVALLGIQALTQRTNTLATTVSQLETDLTTAQATIITLENTQSAQATQLINLETTLSAIETEFSTLKLAVGKDTATYDLDVEANRVNQAVAHIANLDTGATSIGLNIQLGANMVDTTNNFVQFLDGSGAVIGKITGNGTGGVTYATSGADLAEYFPKVDPADKLTPGTIVCLHALGGVKACESSAQKPLGIVSAQAGFVGNSDKANNPNYVLVGIVGQVDVPTTLTLQTNDPVSIDDAGQLQLAKPGEYSVGRVISNQNNQATIYIQPSLYLGDVTQTIAQVADQTDKTKRIDEQVSQLETELAQVKSDQSDAEQIWQELTSLTQHNNQLQDTIEQLTTRLAALEDAEVETTPPVTLDDLQLSALNQLVDQAADKPNEERAQVVAGTTGLVLGASDQVETEISESDVIQSSSFDMDTKLSLQPSRLANIEFMAGLISIDTDGNMTLMGELTAQKITTPQLVINQLRISDQDLSPTTQLLAQDQVALDSAISNAQTISTQSIGTSSIPAGEIEVTITSTTLEETSKIFTSLRTATGGQSLIVGSIEALEAADNNQGLYQVSISLEQPIADDVLFDWWIIN